MKYWHSLFLVWGIHTNVHFVLFGRKNINAQRSCVYSVKYSSPGVLFPVWISKLMWCLMKVWYPKSSCGIGTIDRRGWLYEHDLLWQECGTGRNKGVKWLEQALNATAQIRWKFRISEQVLTLMEEAIRSFILLVIIVYMLHQEIKTRRENEHSHKKNDASCHCISSLDMHIHLRDTQTRAWDQFFSLTTVTKKLWP